MYAMFLFNKPRDICVIENIIAKTICYLQFQLVCDKLFCPFGLPPLINKTVGEPVLIISLEVFYTTLKLFSPLAWQMVFCFPKFRIRCRILHNGKQGHALATKKASSNKKVENAFFLPATGLEPVRSCPQRILSYHRHVENGGN